MTDFLLCKKSDKVEFAPTRRRTPQKVDLRKVFFGVCRGGFHIRPLSCNRVVRADIESAPTLLSAFFGGAAAQYRKKVVVNQRRYERACKRIADENEPFFTEEEEQRNGRLIFA